MGQYFSSVLTLRPHIVGRNFGSLNSQPLQVLINQPSFIFILKSFCCQLEIYLLNYEALPECMYIDITYQEL